MDYQEMMIGMDGIEFDAVLGQEFDDNESQDLRFLEEDEHSPISNIRYQYIPTVNCSEDDMLVRYENIRTDLRSVKLEFYKLAQYISSLHMSHQQIEEAVCATLKILFGRRFTPYKTSNIVDENTTIYD